MSELEIDRSSITEKGLRPFLVGGIAFFLIVVALLLSLLRGHLTLAQYAKQDVFAPSEKEGEGIVGLTNDFLKVLLQEVDTTVQANSIEELNRRYPALEFALPYTEANKPVVDAADLRLVGINPDHITDEEWRKFYYNSRLPKLLRDQREEIGETYFNIQAVGVLDSVNKKVRHIEIRSIRLYASMFKVALVKTPWKGDIYGRQNCLFGDSAAVFLTYGGSMVPIPVQPNHNAIGAVKQTINAVMDTCLLLGAGNRPLDYYQIYRKAFDRTNPDRERAVSINLCETRGAAPMVSFVVSCARRGQGRELKIVSGADVLVFRGKEKVDTIKASVRGAEKAVAPVPVVDGMKLAVYGRSGRKLGEFVVNTTDPTHKLSSIIQSNTGLARYNIPACQTDLFTQQVIRGVTRHLSFDNEVPSVNLSLDPMLSLEFENSIRNFVHQLPGKLPPNKPRSQCNEQYDMSVTIMNIATGEVLATPFYTTKFDAPDYPQQLKMTTRNVALSRRSIGSTFKPIEALAAVQANPGLLNLNTEGHVHLRPKVDPSKRVDPERKADFFGYIIKNPWAQLAPSHWNGTNFVDFLKNSDDVYPAALVAIAMGGGRRSDAIATQNGNSFFQAKADRDLYLRQDTLNYTTHPFFSWLAHITRANIDSDADDYELNPLRGIQNRNDSVDDRTYGLREIMPDVTNLHFDKFAGGVTFRSEVVPWVLGQGGNDWSPVAMAQAWARMIGRHDVIATYIASQGNPPHQLTELSAFNVAPGCNLLGGAVRQPEDLNTTWNAFLDNLSAATSGGTLLNMHRAVDTLNHHLNNRGGDPLVLFCKTGTPNGYSRYEEVLLDGHNRFYDIGMFSFALMSQSAVERVKQGGKPNGIVCIVRVTRTYHCNKCSATELCSACSTYNGLQSDVARDYFARSPYRMRMLYDMTSRYYNSHE